MTAAGWIDPSSSVWNWHVDATSSGNELLDSRAALNYFSCYFLSFVLCADFVLGIIFHSVKYISKTNKNKQTNKNLIPIIP